MTDFKHQYEKINASEKLKKRVESTMRREKRRQLFKKAALSAAAILVVSIGILNLFPSIAFAVNELPLFSGIVQVLTFNRYDFEENNYGAHVDTPIIDGLSNEELQRELNEKFAQYSESLITEFESNLDELKEEMGEEFVHLGFDSGYQVITNNDRFFSIEIYTVDRVGTFSIRYLYTVDKEKGELLQLKDLFAKDVDYITPISKYIREEMDRRNLEEGCLFWEIDNPYNFEAFEKIKEDQEFFINDKDQLVIFFNKHEVAAGVQGSPEFIIPKSILSELTVYSVLK